MSKKAETSCLPVSRQCPKPPLIAETSRSAALTLYLVKDKRQEREMPVSRELHQLLTNRGRDLLKHMGIDAPLLCPFGLWFGAPCAELLGHIFLLSCTPASCYHQPPAGLLYTCGFFPHRKLDVPDGTVGVPANTRPRCGW